jgi:hypothetical protein
MVCRKRVRRKDDEQNKNAGKKSYINYKIQRRPDSPFRGAGSLTHPVHARFCIPFDGTLF